MPCLTPLLRMAQLRLALLFDTDSVYVELAPEILKTLLEKVVADNIAPDRAYDMMVEELKKLTFKK